MNKIEQYIAVILAGMDMGLDVPPTALSVEALEPLFNKAVELLGVSGMVNALTYRSKEAHAWYIKAVDYRLDHSVKHHKVVPGQLAFWMAYGVRVEWSDLHAAYESRRLAKVKSVMLEEERKVGAGVWVTFCIDMGLGMWR